MDLPLRGGWSRQSVLLGAGSSHQSLTCGSLCTYLVSPGWSLLDYPCVAADPLPALSSASHRPASGSWALLRELCCLSGITPLSTGLIPRFLLEDTTNLLSKQMVDLSDTQSILSWVPPKRDPKQRNPLKSNFPTPYVTVLTHSNIRVLVYSILHGVLSLSLGRFFPHLSLRLLCQLTM